VRKAWLTSAMALGTLIACGGQAGASPVAMAMHNTPSANSAGQSSKNSWAFWHWEDKPQSMAAVKPAAYPSEQISPWKHPVRYFSAAVSETPVARKWREKSKSPGSDVSESDRISLSTPVGPPSPQLVISLAQLAERQGNVPQARKALQGGLATWPNDVELLRAAARMEDRQGDLVLAESLYRRAVAANPQHSGALNDLGLCLAREGRLDESIQAIEQAVHLQPDKALYRNNAATVLVEMQQDHKALAHLSAVHGPAVANYNMGQLLAARGRPDESMSYFETALQLDPGLEAARVAIAQLNGGATATQPQVASEELKPQRSPESSEFGPQLTPQPSNPTPDFPATARGPAFGTQSYMPPTGYPAASAVAAPGAPVYRSATAPRYLPPVPPVAPNTVVR
jgi:tetratricopeptide (TPR) repeat protein